MATGSNRSVSFAIGFMIGLVAGGGAAAVLAPQSGAQLREVLRERGLELKDRAEDLLVQAQARVSQALGRAS